MIVSIPAGTCDARRRALGARNAFVDASGIRRTAVHLIRAHSTELADTLDRDYTLGIATAILDAPHLFWDWAPTPG
jgi:hypothetical protein